MRAFYKRIILKSAAKLRAVVMWVKIVHDKIVWKFIMNITCGAFELNRKDEFTYSDHGQFKTTNL